jgi:hypothetical protein
LLLLLLLLGGWRKYAEPLEEMITEFKNNYLPNLITTNALPFKNEMNWEMDPDFDYDN